MKNYVYLFVVLFAFLWPSLSVSGGKSETELTASQAIKIASIFTTKNKYDATKVDVEAIKVTKGTERGPIRLLWLLRYFSGDEVDTILKNEFWIVYFYPKGFLEDRTLLGGGFCVLVDLYSGKILFSLQD